MIKKVSVLLLVAAILITGYISFRKLNYWERSVMIFKFDSSAQSLRGRGVRGIGESGRPAEGLRQPGFSDESQGPDGQIIPDSLRRKIEARGQRSINRIRPGSESQNVARDGRNQVSAQNGEIHENFRGRDGNGGRNFRRGNAVNLSMVLYYLCVFALFTVIMVYLEKAYWLIIKKKKLTREESDLII